MEKKNKNYLIKRSELVKISGVRDSTIKFYSEQGLLSYKKKDKRLARRYDQPETIKRLNEIKKLKDKRLRIDEIKKHFRK